MKMLIKEFAKLSGVSVRTLHYYDEIGLLKPAFCSEQNGYRFYDESSLERMQEIMFYRELDFELKSISKILSSPDYDKQKALREQRKLLILKKERLERIIDALKDAEKGKITMTAFDKSDYETVRKQYETEAKERWGKTEAYCEHTEKTKDYSKDKWAEVNDGLMAIFAEFNLCKGGGFGADSAEAQAIVSKLKTYITNNYYTCTNDILLGLGKMYVADERFQDNIDRHGKGTAEFVAEAIKIYGKTY